MTDKKVPVEKHRIRARNSYEVLSQIVETYNSSNGWSLTKVIPSPLNLDVYLERSSKQGNSSEVTSSPEDESSPKVADKEVSVEKVPAKEEVKVAETAKKPTATRKASKTTPSKSTPSK